MDSISRVNYILCNRLLDDSQKVKALADIHHGLREHCDTLKADFERRPVQDKVDLITNITRMIATKNIVAERGTKPLSNYIEEINNILIKGINTEAKVNAMDMLRDRLASDVKVGVKAKAHLEELTQQVFQMLTTFHTFNMSDIPTRSTFASGFTEAMLKVGDVIELTSDNIVSAHVPLHFLSTDQHGNWNIGYGPVKLTGQLMYLCGDYVVVEVLDPRGNHHVTCVKVDNQEIKIGFFQTPDCTPYVKSVYLKGKMKVEKETMIKLTPIT